LYRSFEKARCEVSSSFCSSREEITSELTVRPNLSSTILELAFTATIQSKSYKPTKLAVGADPTIRTDLPAQFLFAFSDFP
jgi:hypothetical protein